MAPHCRITEFNGVTTRQPVDVTPAAQSFYLPPPPPSIYLSPAVQSMPVPVSIQSFYLPPPPQSIYLPLQPPTTS